MKKILLYDQDGARAIEVETIDLTLLRKYCTPDDGGHVEAAHGRFKSPGITIWVDEEGRLDELPVWAKLKSTGEDFCGPLIVTGISRSGNAVGLTNTQIKLVRECLEWVPGVPGEEPTVTVIAWPDEDPEHVHVRH